MNDDKTIPLSQDNTLAQMEGEPAPLEPQGDVTIVPKKGNPDETVKLDPDLEDVQGVEVAKEVEEEFGNT
jgi:3-dehydroquinate synthase class II